MKQRIDVYLTANGLADSREKAQALIMAGQVYIGEKKVLKASEQVAPDAPVVIRGAQDAFASRGGHKLEKAVAAFRADVTGRVAMDIGAAAGGFTDVLLRHGAAHVYAIDVGYGQLDWKLRNDPRVTVMERTNARTLTAEQFDPRPDLTVMDVSFISIKLILPSLKPLLKENADLVCLIKPQFEAGREDVGKKGVVRDSEVHARVIRDILSFAPQIGLSPVGLDYSPIRGPEGNIEFICHMKNGPAPSTEFDVDGIVAASHSL